jgi:hypothetical protein
VHNTAAAERSRQELPGAELTEERGAARVEETMAAYRAVRNLVGRDSWGKLTFDL